MTMTSARAGVAAGDLAGSSLRHAVRPLEADIDEFAAVVASELV
jgi:hypothetical protein